MVATRHPPTLILPDLPKQALVGIDFLSLTASTRFNGFTTLPPGWHFLFVSATTELSSRQGVWFNVPDPSDQAPTSHAGQKRQRADSQVLGNRGVVIPSTTKAVEVKDWLAVLKWDTETESLRAVEDETNLEEWRQTLLADESLQKSLFPYRQTVQTEQRIQEVEDDEKTNAPQTVDFVSLSDHVSGELLDRVCGHSSAGFWSLDTASSAHVDAEAEHIPGLESHEKFQSKPLGLVDIDLKRTWPEDAVGRQRTEGARDRSWRLSEVVQRASGRGGNAFADADGMSELASWGAELLGEMQFCFIAVLTLANWSSMAQWRRILELVMTCYSIVPQRSPFFASFLGLLSMQLTHTNLVEGGLFDVKDDGGAFLQDLLRRFNVTLSEIEREHSGIGTQAMRREMTNLQDTVRDIWQWELGNDWARKGMVQLEDGEMVELENQDMEDEDERGEYAPQIVEFREGSSN